MIRYAFAKTTALAMSLESVIALQVGKVWTVTFRATKVIMESVAVRNVRKRHWVCIYYRKYFLMQHMKREVGKRVER